MDYSYVAGFFDGEGHIRVKSPERTKRVPQVSASQSVKQHEVLFRIKDWLGTQGIESSVYTGSKRYNPKHSLKSVIEIRKLASVYKLLNELLPLLIVKKKAAEEAVKVIETTDWRLGSYVMPQATKDKLSEAQRKYGKTHPESWARLWTPEARVNWMRTRPEATRKWKEASIRYWSDPENRRKASERRKAIHAKKLALGGVVLP